MSVLPRQIEAAAKVLVTVLDQAVKTDRLRVHVVGVVAEHQQET
jgi:hypothetical protein